MDAQAVAEAEVIVVVTVANMMVVMIDLQTSSRRTRILAAA